MSSTRNGWKIVDEETPVLTYKYRFGAGIANALAVGVDDGIAIVSPPVNVADGVFNDLKPYGDVTALVGANAFHYLGLVAWKARFPEAHLYAPAQSVARIQKRSKLKGIEPLAKAGMLAKHLELIDMPHYKTGEVLVRIATNERPIWYLTDVLMNLSALPPQLAMKVIFKLTNTAPGLKFNNIASTLMVQDKRALKKWLLAEATREPPSRVLLAHGEPLEVSPDARELRAVLEA